MKSFGFITRDFWRKLAALLFAFVIYWNVNEYLHEEKKISGVPLEINPTQDLVMTSAPRITVSLTVRGIQRELNELDAGSISGSVEVSPSDRQSDGAYKVHVTPDNFRRFGGVKVVSVDSGSDIILHLQRRISREVPVSMRFSGALSEAFRISDSTCIPSSVMVSGPENELASLKELMTEPIPLTDRESGFEYETKLVPPGSLTATPDKVTAQIGVERNIVQHDFPALPVGLFSDSKSDIRAAFTADNPPSAAVTVSGPTQIVGTLNSDDLRLYVDVSNVSTPGVYSLPVKCHIRRSGIESRSIVPAEFKVLISKSPIKK